MIGLRLRHLPVPLLISALLLVLAAGVGWLVDGGAGAAGGALGVAIVTFSYTLSSLVLAWADSVQPKLVMSFGLATYIGKFALFGVVMFAVARTDWPGLRAMAVAIIVATVCWVTAQVWWTVRQPFPQVDTARK